jgi:hypothetical protein
LSDVSAGVVSDPVSAFDPVQPPDAVQLATFVAFQLRVVVPPGATPGGDAVNATVGPLEAVTPTLTFATAPPPAPLHVNVYVVLVEMALLVALPVTGLVPLQPPDAVHVSALLADHESCVVPPLETLVGLADMLTVGGLVPPVTGALEPPDPPPPHAAAESNHTKPNASLVPQSMV